MFDKEGMEKIISAAIISALGEGKGEALLAEMVDRMLKAEVDMSSGAAPSYGSKEKGSFLEFMAQQRLRGVVGEAVGAWIGANADPLKAMVTKKLNEGGIAQAYVDALTRQVGEYGFHVHVSVPAKSKDDY